MIQENNMRKYGTNSAYAVIRLLTMVNIVKRELAETQIRLLSDIAIAQELTQDDILRIIAEYEIDVVKTGKDGPFFNGDPSLPQALVSTGLDEIQGQDLQLQVCQIMHGLLTVSGSPQKEEIFFVEHAVGYWGIGDIWRTWLLSQPSSNAS